MLQHVFIRTSRAATVTETVFATTTDPSDDPVAGYCDFSGIPFTRGSLFDVLDRYYQAAKGAKADCWSPTAPRFPTTHTRSGLVSALLFNGSIETSQKAPGKSCG